MKIERQRPFNTGERYGAGTEGLRASMTVKAGDRIFLSGLSGLDLDHRMPEGAGAAAQAEQAMENVTTLLAEVGSSINHLCQTHTWMGDFADRPDVYNVVGRHLAGVPTVATGLVARALARPDLKFNVDFQAVIPAGPDGHEKFHLFDTGNWFGQNRIARPSCKIIRTADEVFLRGQAGTALDGSKQYGPGFTPADAAEQADISIVNAKTLLADAGADFNDVAKIHVYIRDRAYREAVYQVIGKHLRDAAPCSTGLIVRGFARLPILFEIDMAVPLTKGTPHQRLRVFETQDVYPDGQRLDCRFAMACRAGKRVFLRGQTGTTLDGNMVGLGDPAAQADQAMRNVAQLLDEAGASLDDTCKLTLYLIDREFRDDVEAVIARHLGDIAPCYTLVVVDGLANPAMLLEIDVDAVIQR